MLVQRLYVKAARIAQAQRMRCALAWLRKQAVALQRPGKQVNWGALKREFQQLSSIEISRAEITQLTNNDLTPPENPATKPA